MNPILVTGGAGFIGSNFVLRWLATEGTPVVVLDKLTYAGNLGNLAAVQNDRRYTFVKGDIVDRELVRSIFETYAPWAVIHFAAESHVDRSIAAPGEFIRTNIQGTFELLEAAREHCGKRKARSKGEFRFLHVSTDEVYGSLKTEDAPFLETTPYAPNSPYSASKAASDHLVRSYHHTYGLPTLTTNCSNNYGPRQFPEKLIPLMLLNATRGKRLPVYGNGENVRDWLFVEDHCEAIRCVLHRGRVGETYNIGGRAEMKNLDVVRCICRLLDEMRPAAAPHHSLISFVTDRPGHDWRYAMNITKISSEVGWQPKETFESGMRKTIEWYLENPDWVADVTSGSYRQWIEAQYATAD